MSAFGAWAEVIDLAWRQGGTAVEGVSPEHWDGGVCGGAAAVECGQSGGRSGMRATAGAARYWCEKALSKGLRHLATRQARHQTPSRLERHNRELRRREQLGTVWTEHNLLALLPEQGLLNQTA